jgi:hypothetical protein
MQDVRLSISLQQLKMKEVELTQTRPTSFQGGVPKTFWCYWFKHTHLEL